MKALGMDAKSEEIRKLINDIDSDGEPPFPLRMYLPTLMRWAVSRELLTSFIMIFSSYHATSREMRRRRVPTHPRYCWLIKPIEDLERCPVPPPATRPPASPHHHLED